MHKPALLIVVLGIAGVAAGVAGGTKRTAAPAADAGAFVIKDVRVFDGENVLERASVLVRNGTIVQVGADLTLPAGVPVIEGAGRTLLPGLIDAHTHVFGEALARALVFGVTTELDMFMDHRQAARRRSEQRSETGAASRADVFSAGTLVTAPKGHGTQFDLAIPTIDSPAEAAAFVDARIAEGADYIKVVYEQGDAYGLSMPSISEETLRAVIRAAKARGRLALVHVGSRAAAETAVAAGASGLVHIFANEPPSAEFGSQVKTAGAFVIPTLSVIESAGGTAGGAALTKVPGLAPYLSPDEHSALQAFFPQRSGSKVRLAHAIEATRQLHAAGVPILAGSDAPNSGMVHGATVHRELELLVETGLSPREALATATSVPARAFGLADRGRIAPGLRADLLLVGGNPLVDITATRHIEAIWKGGTRLPRQPAKTVADAAKATGSGLISDFDGAEVTTEFGAGWHISTDALRGGASEAAMTLVKPGAAGSSGALEVKGAIKSGSPFPWAGAMFFPASPPMTPADVSAFTEIVFHASGDEREYQLMVFATRLGDTPVSQPFTAGREWREHVIPFKAFGIDGSDLRGILFSADAAAGAFTFAIDQVRLR